MVFCISLSSRQATPQNLGFPLDGQANIKKPPLFKRSNQKTRHFRGPGNIVINPRPQFPGSHTVHLIHYIRMSCTETCPKKAPEERLSDAYGYQSQGPKGQGSIPSQKPYRTFYRDYQDEFLCLWVVGEEEIVGHWKWDKLVEEKGWYQATILPAFRKHDKRFTAHLSPISLSVSVEVCSDTSSSAEMKSRGQTKGWDEGNSLDSEISPDQHQDLSSEGYSGSLEDYSDPGDSYYEDEANSISFLLNASEEN
ncbi:hypothetical protein NYO67_1295 [Aspergillus flavus]|nr:hypothetical protein NYO67_1295 [Aspergillus flavus]